ncbi:MAG: orotidine-5'-phosphate decarboxylase [Pseudomonadota bacterium]|nr:orotidine-5'-phosphate decarboxylase [Pseudomonadota bacterium]
MSSPVIVAVDSASLDEAVALAARLSPAQCRLKVGKELFTAAGPRAIEVLQQRGFEIFLDLKFHDIPNTVGSACRVAAGLGVWMVDVHVSGGPAMLEAARRAVDSVARPPLLVGITVLTSLGEDDLPRIGMAGPIAAAVERLARLARDCGLDGVVCSAAEAQYLRATMGADFALVTPGIRPAGAAVQDQVRVVTPADALRAGSTYLVIGRPITQAADPQHALETILDSIAFK